MVRRLAIVLSAMGAVMIAECSNPPCPPRFALSKGVDSFVSKMTDFQVAQSHNGGVFLAMPLLLVSDDGSAISVVLPEPVHNSGDFISANRHRGLLLNGASF